MRIYYYYLRDKQNRPLVTVCLGVAGKNIYRGISLCSPKDNPNKRKGRQIAAGRLLQAVHRGHTSGRVYRDEALEVLMDVDYGSQEYLWKSSNNPRLMPVEIKILKENKI